MVMVQALVRFDAEDSPMVYCSSRCSFVSVKLE